jgi:hypothetical protein
VFYVIGLDNLRHRCQVKTSGTTASSNEEVITLIGSSIVKSMIPDVISLIKSYLVCPATSSSAEEAPRGTMSQKRLNFLLVLSTYTNVLD